MKNITKNKYQFVESRYKFNNSKKSIEIESECFKEFFPYINILYLIGIILTILIIVLIICFCYLQSKQLEYNEYYDKYIVNSTKILHIIFISFVFFFVVMYINKSIKPKKILLNFSSSGVNIKTEDNSNLLFIESLNIEDIYPNIFTINFERSSEKLEGYAIILKCKKSIFLNLKGYKKEFILFDCITKETYKKVFKEKIKKIKEILNLYEGKKDHNSLQNFNFEERIFFTRNENNLKIIVNSGSAFFFFFFEDNLKIQLGILVIFYTFILNFIPIPNILIIVGSFIGILSLIYYYLNNTPKIIFTISKQGIEVNFRNHIINIKKEEIKSIKCIADNDETVKEMIEKNIIEKDSELTKPNYHKIILKLKHQISLEPIRKLFKSEFNLFGYIDLIHSDISNLLETELKQMIK